MLEEQIEQFRYQKPGTMEKQWTIYKSPHPRHITQFVFSALDWVLSHWLHFTVHSLDLVVFICVYFVFFFNCIYVVLVSAQWGGPNGIEAQSLGLLFLRCFDTVGWVF